MVFQVVSLGNRVGGIARPEDGPAVFIRGALPGETVLARVIAGKKTHSEAELLRVLSPAPERVSPFCSMHHRCGGCALAHLDYGHQLKWKKKWVEKALRDFPGVPVDDPVPSPRTRGYRNRVTFRVSGGKVCLHAFRGDPVPIDDCPALDRPGRELLKKLLKNRVPPGIDSFSIRCSRNPGGARIETEDRERPIPGYPGPEAPLFEKLLDWTFPIPPGAFFQVNSAAAEKLILEVLGMARGRRMIDLYGGVGTFGIPLASRGARVDSVEINRNACQAGEAAAVLNGVEGFRTIPGRERVYLSGVLDQGRKFDALILDPPRAGAGIRVMRLIRRLGAEQVIYVSCNPFTAARDMRVLTGGGYDLIKAVPVDMFPNTDHVESVFLLERKQS